MYRTQGSWTDDETTDTFEQLTWFKSPRDEGKFIIEC